jgi:hypothetical protein
VKYAQRRLCPQPKEFYREGAKDAKDAKLREVDIKFWFLLRETSLLRSFAVTHLRIAD